MLRWQKSLVDWYGHKNLVKFNAGAGDEWSASNAFESGKVAMHLDGEWRVSFIANEAKKLSYATAPMPTDKPDLYGSGYITGTIIGIPKGAKNLQHSWLLTRYLTTNSSALATFSNGIRNVPTTKASLKSKILKPDKNFDTFLNIFAHPKSATHPITAVGAAYQETRHELGDEVAVREGRRPDVLAEDARQADRRTAQAGGGPGG